MIELERLIKMINLTYSQAKLLRKITEKGDTKIINLNPYSFYYINFQLSINKSHLVYIPTLWNKMPSQISEAMTNMVFLFKKRRIKPSTTLLTQMPRSKGYGVGRSYCRK